MMRPATIAIDGPAASGKSTLGYHLAQYLGYLYLDTGVLYRAVTWAALHNRVPIEDEAAVTHLAQTLDIQVLQPTEDDGRQYTIRCIGHDITWAIRSPEVNHAVSPVSVYPGVRAALTQRMREMATRGSIVMVGRDIGTVVLPDADLKLYVIASAEARAYRRHIEMLEQGKAITYEAVLENLKRRDGIDSSRETAPLKAAPDAVVFDTTQLNIEEMFGEAERLIDNGRAYV
ncbi:MAG: (d)CMP kinase [Anaerolineae bacterium]|nr:(d)CMP kinase [Anaerolineae bacterium]